MKKTKYLGAVSVSNGTEPARLWNEEVFHVGGTSPANLGENDTTNFDLLHQWLCNSTCQDNASKSAESTHDDSRQLCFLKLADEPNPIEDGSQDAEKIPGGRGG